MYKSRHCWGNMPSPGDWGWVDPQNCRPMLTSSPEASTAYRVDNLSWDYIIIMNNGAISTRSTVVSAGLPWSPVVFLGVQGSPVVSRGLCWSLLVSAGLYWSPLVSIGSRGLCLVFSALLWSPGVSPLVSPGLKGFCWSPEVSAGLQWSPWTPLEIRRDHWRPRDTSKDHWRSMETTTSRDHWRPVDTRRDHWRPKESPGPRRPAETNRDQQ